MHAKTIVIAASSDIGLELSDYYLTAGHEVIGTYRTYSPSLASLEQRGLKAISCDLASQRLSESLTYLKSISSNWDNLILCPGTQDPVGPFSSCNFDKWQESINTNFVSQMRVIHQLLPFRRVQSPNGPLVLLFAGGGTNNATHNYSAYTLSKIALIKACELLDAEISDTRFTILGPGWVKTKIHQSTIEAGPSLAGTNYQKTLDKLSGTECNPISKVIECCDWVVNSSRSIVGGRNFSVVFDSWGSPSLDRQLTIDPDMYKLRRSGNSYTAP
jgi:short-subunit dehydrogenase